MRIGWLWALLLSVSLIVATAGVAWAHIEVSPEEVPANTYERFAVSVPTERDDASTTEVRLEVPEGFLVSGVQPVPGWQQELEEEGGVVTHGDHVVRRRDTAAGVPGVPLPGPNPGGDRPVLLEGVPDLRQR